MEDINKLKKNVKIYGTMRRIFSFLIVSFLVIGLTSFLIGLGQGKSYMIFGLIFSLLCLICLILNFIFIYLYNHTNKKLNNINPNLIDIYDEEIVAEIHYEDLNLEYLKSSEKISKEKVFITRLVLSIISILLFLMSLFCFFSYFINIFETNVRGMFSLFSCLIGTNTTEKAIYLSSMQSFFNTNRETFLFFCLEIVFIFTLTIALIFLVLSIAGFYYAFSNKIYNLIILIRSITFKRKIPFIIFSSILIFAIFIITCIIFFFISIVVYSNPYILIKPSVSFIISCVYLGFIFIVTPFILRFLYKLFKEIQK